ncbi:uncharacterized protein A1O5_06311 [Cladophialophora psammophila CBS 110553]|uniref:Gti1/Pac2 family protein n=1 Tax=Cladophialophora psammophila CBS 110553 TaxID=1182543 RepID=W9WQP6_9EURO|nr:uncharacterized protein A1O5_06311 [Cladophialophora psammophila CBS 110553]EXJ70243.1 hypothetical protein A1O5_06311 [Cladophialophora psammophila CBS 110553]
MSSGGAPLQPTFQGHVATTQDALILFEACLQGHLSHVPRRPHDRERSNLIRSGCVFIYEENASGIKRWTDGVTWSPSRILGNFLVYRELDKPFPPGEKKRAMKKQTRRPSRPGEPYARSEGGSFSDGQSGNFSADQPTATDLGRQLIVERQLIGSLVDSYGFKQDGLVKKTMSVTVQGITHHLVSYYHVNDVLNNQLRTPSQTENLQYIRPRAELTSRQSFRAPIEDVDEVEGAHNVYGYRVNAAGYAPQPYYIPPGYPPMAQQPSQPQYSMAVPSMSSPYIQSPVTTSHMQGQRNDYSQYDQSGYNRSYESLNSSIAPSSKAIPATPTTMAPVMPDRTPAQPTMYPPMNMQRPVNTLSPVSMDSRAAVPYRPSPYAVGHSNGAPIDQTRQSQPSPTQADRRESAPQQASMYQGPRTPYYPDTAGPSIPQPQYSQWAGQTHNP